MIDMLLKQKAQTLRALHYADAPLLLPNIWSPLGARMLEAKGFPAVATASAAISASLGYQDGEKIKFTTLLDIASRIANSVDVPTTIDIERGYASTDAQLIDVINQVLDAGIVGINIEDSMDEGLRDIDLQAARIALIRGVANQRGIHLVINARIDCFILPSELSNTQKLQMTIARASAYLAAGADCIYPIAIDDIDVLKQLRSVIVGPINVLFLPEKMDQDALKEIAINRISYGPFVFRALLKQFDALIDQISVLGHTDGLRGNMLSAAEIQTYLRDSAED